MTNQIQTQQIMEVMIAMTTIAIMTIGFRMIDKLMLEPQSGQLSIPSRFRVEQTTVDKVIDDLERTWHRIDSDMSIRMQEALGILKHVMAYYYEEKAVVVWDNSNLIGIAAYRTIIDRDMGVQDTHISELASFTYEPGVGKLLVEKIIEIAKKESSDTVTASHAPGYRDFYEKLGFVKDYRYPEAPTLMMYDLKKGNPAADEIHCLICDKLLEPGNMVVVEYRSYSPKAKFSDTASSYFCKECWKKCLQQNRIGDSFGKLPVAVNGVPWDEYKKTATDWKFYKAGSNSDGVKTFQYTTFEKVWNKLDKAAEHASDSGDPKLIAAADVYYSLVRMAGYVDIGTLLAYSADSSILGGAMAALTTDERWGKAWELYGIFSFSPTPGIGEVILKEVIRMAKADNCVALLGVPKVPRSLDFFKRHNFKYAPGEQKKPLGEAIWVKYINGGTGNPNGMPAPIVSEIQGNITARIEGVRAVAELSVLSPSELPMFGLEPDNWLWFNRLINQSGIPRVGTLLLDAVLKYCKEKGYSILNQVSAYGDIKQKALEDWYISKGFTPVDYKKYGNTLLKWIL